jgi:hypothetical protein
MPKTISAIILLFAAFSLRCVGGQAQTNNPAQPAFEVLIGNQVTNFDPGTKEMIDAWPHGQPTNGIYCALQLLRDAGVQGTPPVCVLNVVDASSNDVKMALYLPQNVLFNAKLFDSNGKQVEQATTNQFSGPWTLKQIENWRMRGRVGHFNVARFSYSPISTFGIPDFFKLSRPGDYTLHVQVQMAQVKADKNQKPYLETFLLPEAVANVLIQQGDINKVSKIIPAQNPSQK